MQALEAWCVGKTVADVLAMPFVEGGHGSVPADVDLAAGCSVDISEQLKALEKAAAAK